MPIGPATGWAKMKLPNTLPLLDRLPLTGLEMAPPQVLGGVRLVPLLRAEATSDLRVAIRKYHEDEAIVSLPDGSSYTSFVPHALVADWSGDGSPVASFGAQFSKPRRRETRDGRVIDFGVSTARVMPRMAIRENRRRLRFLPLHVAMEGFLALHFGGPNMAWEEYSRAALRDGLSPRIESSIPGRSIIGLEDALRVFEIHTSQVGVLMFVGDTLASTFVVPHPDDYRELHATLLGDFFGELLFFRGLYASENVYHPELIRPESVESVTNLHQELQRLRDGWRDLHQIMIDGLSDRTLTSEPVYRMGPFQMERFMTDLDPKSENHIGEAIIRRDGGLEYLKTYRLSAAQCRRAYLLKQLAQCDWNLKACAEKVECNENQLIYRIEKAGFGYLLHQHVLDAARKAISDRN